MVIYRHNKGKENLQNQKGTKKCLESITITTKAKEKERLTKNTLQNNQTLRRWTSRTKTTKKGAAKSRPFFYAVFLSANYTEK